MFLKLLPKNKVCAPYQKQINSATKSFRVVFPFADQGGFALVARTGRNSIHRRIIATCDNIISNTEEF